MKRKILSVLFALGLILSFSLVAAVPAAAAGTIKVPSDYSTIQAAINAASLGDTIEVAAGTYDEQLTITTNGLILQGKTGAKIAPTSLTASSTGEKAIITVDGATGVVIDGFTIEGPVDGINYGVMVVDGGEATIKNNAIKAIRDEAFSGRQSGIAILVYHTSTATIDNNSITDFQKGGIVVDNEGSSATITGNTVTGAGKTDVTAQNGIQISRGASAVVRGNFISDIWYDTGVPGQGQEPWWSAGLLLYDVSPSQIKDSQNMFRNCHVNRLLLPSSLFK